MQIQILNLVVFIDGDGTYSASDLNSILEPLLNDQADMVVGSRIEGKREKDAITLFNTFGNKVFKINLVRLTI
jgi:hypothetical protein